MKIAKLLLVSGDKNSNKFYDMEQVDANSFKVSYGRYGQSPQVASYPIRQWSSKYNEKIKKGYVDVTELHVEDTATSSGLTNNEQLDEILRYLISVSQQSFNRSYSSGLKITKIQIAKAQEILNDISVESDLIQIQKLYLDLFTTIPRVMSDVKSYLPNSTESALRLLGEEQKILDNATVQSSFVSTSGENLLTKLGVEMSLGKINSEIEEILQGRTDMVKTVIEIKKPSTDIAFNEMLAKASNKKTILAWHGTAEQNVLSICSLSLRVRPTNVANGSMLGLAAYVSQEFQKSYNYTRGNRKFMFIYKVHVGKELIADTRNKIKQYTLAELQNLGYDSVFAPSGVDTGWNALRYSERTVYQSEQLTPRYLLEVK